MKNIKLTLLSLSFLFIGCGTNMEEKETKVYDLWEYMVPLYSYEIEYESYQNNIKVDYFLEINRVLSPSLLKRERANYYSTLIKKEHTLYLEENRDTQVDIQRFVKLGDTHIFNGDTTYSCNVENFFHSIKLKEIEFFNVITINCINEFNKEKFFYAYKEGLVFRSKENTIEKEESIKIGERRVE